MGDFFTLAQRQLQGEFETTDLADRIVEAVVTEELSDPQAEFIHSRNMFYLSTIDESGYPFIGPSSVYMTLHELFCGY